MESATNFSDLLLGVGRDSDTAVLDGVSRHSYADLRSAVAAIMTVMSERGLAPGSRVGVLGHNSFFWVAAYLAAMRAGTVIPLSDKVSGDELESQLSWVECDAVLVDRRTLRRAGSALNNANVITDEVLTTSEPGVLPGAFSGRDSDAVLVFTSGTTSRPKVVRITHPNLVANTQSIVTYLGLKRSDRVLVVLPFHYCFGASLLHTHLAVGGSVVLCNSFTFPETAVDLIEREQCTGIAGVPSSYQLLLRASSYSKRDLPSLRIVQQAGGRLAPSSIRELAAAQPRSRLYVMYGQTEATARLSYLPPDRLADKLGSIGRGIPGVDLRVLDENDQPVVPGEQGEIVAAGENISPGYLRDPKETERKFRNGALRTGDQATVDEDGFIYIVGRSEDFIKSWGHRISPQQIEEVVLARSDVAEAVVVGLPDDQAGERVALAVVYRPNEVFDRDGLMAFLRGRLPKHMIPQVVAVLDDLPLNANGKVSRAALRVQLEQMDIDGRAG